MFGQTKKVVILYLSNSSLQKNETTIDFQNYYSSLSN